MSVQVIPPFLEALKSRGHAQPVPSAAVACNHPASYWAARGYKSTAIVLQIAVTRSATRTGGDPASCSVPFC